MQWNAVSLTYRGIFLTAGMEKGIKYNQDHPSIVLHFEQHNFQHNAVVLRVMLKSIMLKFFSIMYLTLFATQTFNGGYKRKKKAPVEGLCSKPKYRANTIHHFIFVFFLYFFYHSSCHKDQFTVLSLKFGILDFTDPGLLKIRLSLAGLLLWFLPSQVLLRSCNWYTRYKK